MLRRTVEDARTALMYLARERDEALARAVAAESAAAVPSITPCSTTPSAQSMEELRVECGTPSTVSSSGSDSTRADTMAALRAQLASVKRDNREQAVLIAELKEAVAVREEEIGR